MLYFFADTERPLPPTFDAALTAHHRRCAPSMMMADEASRIWPGFEMRFLMGASLPKFFAHENLRYAGHFLAGIDGGHILAGATLHSCQALPA